MVQARQYHTIKQGSKPVPKERVIYRTVGGKKIAMGYRGMRPDAFKRLYGEKEYGKHYEDGKLKTRKKSSGKRKGTKMAAASKVEKVMREYKHGKLHSGSKKGPKVSSRKQAIAIALSEQRKKNAGGYKHAVQGKHGIQLGTHRRLDGTLTAHNELPKRASVQQLASSCNYPSRRKLEEHADEHHQMKKQHLMRAGKRIDDDALEMCGGKMSKHSAMGSVGTSEDFTSQSDLENSRHERRQARAKASRSMPPRKRAMTIYGRLKDMRGFAKDPGGGGKKRADVLTGRMKKLRNKHQFGVTA